MPNREESNTIKDILASADGSMWFATTIGLAHLQKGQWTLFGVNTGLPSNRILCLAEERDGSRNVLWVGTDKGLARWDGSAWSVFDIRATGLPHERITVPPRSPDGRRGRSSGSGPTSGSRAGREAAGRHFPSGGGLRRRECPALIEGHSGGRSLLWAATDGGGLVRYDGEKWTAEEGLPSDRVLSLGLLDSGAGRRAVGGHRRRAWPAGSGGEDLDRLQPRERRPAVGADRAPVRQPERRQACPVDRA